MLSPAGIEEPLHLRKRRLLSPGFMYSPWKFAFLRQHRIDMNWRSGELRPPKVGLGVPAGTDSGELWSPRWAWECPCQRWTLES